MAHTPDVIIAEADLANEECRRCANQVHWIHLIRMDRLQPDPPAQEGDFGLAVVAALANIMTIQKLSVPENRQETTIVAEAALGFDASVYF
jgi:hypothetical protein